MRVWSRGLGRQALFLDFAKCDVTREGNEVLIRGILREKGIVWQCQVTFTREDIPGLLHFILSWAVLKHFAANVKGFYIFIRDRFVTRQMGLKEKWRRP